MDQLEQDLMAAWHSSVPAEKVALTRLAWERLRAALVERVEPAWCGPDILHPGARPGHPARPHLVDPRQLPRRALSRPVGRAALLHAVAHIEFNAINLALDAVWRFAGLPAAFYADWLQVAAEEAHHFELLTGHLASLGYAYGDFEAHDGLWTMAEKTAHDPLVRMALVPRVLEARGLDVTPALQQRLAQAGDQQAVEILAVILRDELGHVAVGNRWYAWLCAQRGLDPLATFRQLLRDYQAPALRPPFNIEARREAGFAADELLWLQAGADPVAATAPE